MSIPVSCQPNECSIRVSSRPTKSGYRPHQYLNSLSPCSGLHPLLHVPSATSRDELAIVRSSPTPKLPRYPQKLALKRACIVVMRPSQWQQNSDALNRLPSRQCIFQYSSGVECKWMHKTIALGHEWNSCNVVRRVISEVQYKQGLHSGTRQNWIDERFLLIFTDSNWTVSCC